MAINIRAASSLTNISGGCPLEMDQISSEAVHESDPLVTSTIREESNEDGKVERVVIEGPERKDSLEKEAEAEKIENVKKIFLDRPEESERKERIEIVSVQALPRTVEAPDSIINWGVLVQRLKSLFMSNRGRGLVLSFLIGGGIGAGTFAGIREGSIDPKDVKNFLKSVVTDNGNYTIASASSESSLAKTRTLRTVESLAPDKISVEPPRVNLTDPPTWWKKMNPGFNFTLEKSTAKTRTLRTVESLAPDKISVEPPRVNLTDPPTWWKKMNPGFNFTLEKSTEPLTKPSGTTPLKTNATKPSGTTPLKTNATIATQTTTKLPKTPTEPPELPELTEPPEDS